LANSSYLYAIVDFYLFPHAPLALFHFLFFTFKKIYTQLLFYFYFIFKQKKEKKQVQVGMTLSSL